MIRPQHRRTALATVALAALIGLAGCGKHDPAAQTAAPGAEAAAPTAPGLGEQASNAKFNGYVEAYNQLADTYGLGYKAGNYLRQDVAHARKGTSLFFGFELEGQLKLLQQARAQKSDAYPGLDAIADAMIKDLQVLKDLGEAHSNYYRSDAYRDDDYALAKQLDPQIRGAYTDALAQFDKLNAALEQAEDARNEKDLAALKQLPNPIHYETKHVVVLGKRLVDAVASAASPEDASAMAKADAIKAELYQATDVLDKDIRKQHEDINLQMGSRGVVLFQAESLLSNYGNLRDSGDPRKFELMINAYNEMVKNANQL